MDTPSFKLPKNEFDEKKCLIIVPTFEATHSVFITTDDNKSFQFTTSGQLVEAPKLVEKLLTN